MFAESVCKSSESSGDNATTCWKLARISRSSASISTLGSSAVISGARLTRARRYGCRAVTVDAKPEAVGFYERYDFRRKEAASGQLHTGPKPVTLSIGIPTIKDGLRG